MRVVSTDLGIKQIAKQERVLIEAKKIEDQRVLIESKKAKARRTSSGL